MKKSLILSMASVFVLAAAITTSAACTPTGFFRDGINMTAARINPSSVTGVVNATGCNVGVYYSAGAKSTIKNAEIFGANYFGVLANGDAGNVSVDITNSSIHDIGETPLNGTQHGAGIYLRAFFAGGSVTSKISGNTIVHYQKGGIVANGPGTQANISDNIVTGSGHVDFIAMNGIQIGYGASATVMRNTVSGNSYDGHGDGSSSGGILVVGGAGYGTCPDGADCQYTLNTKIDSNILLNNDVGVYVSNVAADFTAPTTATNIKVINNTISEDNCLFNPIYEAGISDVGNNDKMISNTISGYGCPTVYNPSANAIDADTAFTNRPKVHANN